MNLTPSKEAATKLAEQMDIPEALEPLIERAIKEIQANAIEWAQLEARKVNDLYPLGVKVAELRGCSLPETVKAGAPIAVPRFYWRANEWFVHVPKCPKCGGNWKFYDGALGYESFVCGGCKYDFNEIKVYINIPKDIDTPPTNK